MAAARDGCVVETESLSALLAGGSRSRSTAWLAEATRRQDPLGVGIPEATIENVVSARFRTTELRIADALVAAIGRPEAFHDGTLEVRPNPTASREARAACCGGSLTGAVESIGLLYGR